MIVTVDETPEQWKARMGIGQRSQVAQVVGGEGTVRHRPVPRDDKPGMAGVTTEHWSGRQDAQVFPETVRATMRPQVPS